MASVRRSPEEFLRQIQESEQKASHGKLKLFLGASAGVGKTYAMLSESIQLLERGVDLVIGVAVTHGRKDTERLLQGLPVIPERQYDYKGVTLTEFDIDAVLIRRPEIVVVDELAHTNIPGSRHQKRWQDVQELLEAGISVYAALNIQHLESLNDVIAQIAGIRVKETVPDTVLDLAEEVELVDITPDELRQRVKEGKVYVPQQIDQALDGFFKTGNLIALRELALRRVADQIDAQMQSYRQDSGISKMWATRERVLICIAPSQLCEKVLRTGARIANANKFQVTALFVESTRQKGRSTAQQNLATEALRMAEEFGIEVARRTGYDIVSEILHFAQTRNITLIVVGKPLKPRWEELLYGSVVDELVRRAGEINVLVISSGEAAPPKQKRKQELPDVNLTDGVTGLAYTLASTGIAALVDRLLPHENIVMIYLLGITICSSRSRLGSALITSVLSVLAYDFFFVDPRYQFSVSDAKYLPTFGIMLLVGFLISKLNTRLKEEFASASARERRSAALFDATREMVKARGRENIAELATRRLSEDLDVDLCVLLPNEAGRLSVVTRSRSHFENNHRELPVAHWVFDNGRPAGAGTDTLPSSLATYLPLKAAESTVGVLGTRANVEGETLDTNQQAVIKAFSNSLALAIERSNLARESAQARLEVESERLRNSLLSSVSHDIRSPLTAIAGAASALMDGSGNSKALSKTIYQESQRLNRHVRDLLDMTRLESGTLKPNLEWHNLEEIVGTVLGRTEWQLEGRKVEVSVPPDLPLLNIDGTLIEQALVNLIENAGRHTPVSSPLEIVAELQRSVVTIAIIDHGPGIPQDQREKIFEKFHRHSDDQSGFGLGLAISRAIIRMNGGDISVSETAGGGATFIVTLPITPGQPEVPRG